MGEQLNNMHLYDAMRAAPASAVKQIRGGSYGAAGLSDINPQWRIEAMTRACGPVGFGWMWEPVDITERDGVLYGHVIVRYRMPGSGEWSAALHGYGGTKFGGRDDSDIYKSTITDAISNALRFLGVGADVWYNPTRDSSVNQFDTKYSAPPQQRDALDDRIEAPPGPISDAQRQTLAKLIAPDDMSALERRYGDGLVNMDTSEYVRIIARIKARAAREQGGTP